MVVAEEPTPLTRAERPYAATGVETPPGLCDHHLTSYESLSELGPLPKTFAHTPLHLEELTAQLLHQFLLKPEIVFREFEKTQED